MGRSIAGGRELATSCSLNDDDMSAVVDARSTGENRSRLKLQISLVGATIQSRSDVGRAGLQMSGPFVACTAPGLVVQNVRRKVMSHG